MHTIHGFGIIIRNAGVRHTWTHTGACISEICSILQFLEEGGGGTTARRRLWWLEDGGGGRGEGLTPPTAQWERLKCIVMTSI